MRTKEIQISLALVFLPCLFSGVSRAKGLLPQGIGGGSHQVIFPGSGTTAHACLLPPNAHHLKLKCTHNETTTTTPLKPKDDNYTKKPLVPNIQLRAHTPKLNTNLPSIHIPTNSPAIQNKVLRKSKDRFRPENDLSGKTKNISYGKNLTLREVKKWKSFN
jgi:hypothetical protein